MRKSLLMFISVALAVGITACGNDADTKVVEPIEPVSEVKNEVVEEDDVTEEAAEPAEEPEKTESEWVDAYRDFLSDSENLKSVLTALPWETGQLRGFALLDLDNDDIPELIVSAEGSDSWLVATEVYRYSDGNVALAKAFEMGEAEGLGELYKNTKDNEYYLWLENNGMITLTTNLCKYSNTDDVIYWNESDSSDGSIITEKGDRGQYEEITGNLASISFCPLTDKNIQEKIEADYDENEFINGQTESIESDTSADWRNTYYEYIQNNYLPTEEWKYVFINVDNDNIPECYVHCGVGQGAFVMSIQGDNIISPEEDFGNCEYRYRAGENILRFGASAGMGAGFTFYTIENGEFKAMDTLWSDDWDLDGVQSYTINGVEVSEQEYNDRVASHGTFNEIALDDFSSSIMDAMVLE